MKESNFISVVLCCHDVNKDTINEFPQKIYENFLAHFKHYEIIIIDNAGNEEEIKKLSAGLNAYVEHNTLTIVKFPSFVSVETAMIAGDDLAVGDYIFEIDNLNIKFDDTLFMKVYNKMLEGFDVVSVGSSNMKQSIASKIFYRLYNAGVKKEEKLKTEVLRIVSRRAFNRAKAMTKTIAYRKAIYASGGLKRFYIEDSSIRILKGYDKEEVNQRMELGINSLMIFTNVVQRFSFFVSCLFLGFTIAISFYIVGVFLLSRPVAGWTPIMMYLSIGFFGIFSLLTIVLKYLSVILELVYKKDIHVVESIRKV